MADNGPAQDSPPADNSLAPAVSRAMRILDVLAEAQGEPVSLADLARAIGVAKSSTSNISTVLEESGMIQREATGFVLGRRTVELGGAYLASFDQVREFYRACQDSPVLRQELVQLAVLHGTDVIYLARHEGRVPLRLTAGAGVGDRYPAALTAIGNALLSTLPPTEVTALYAGKTFPPLTARSTRSLEQLHGKLALARERGYALDEGEVFPNVAGIAMPVPPRSSGDHAFAVNLSRIVPTDPPHLEPGELATLKDALGDVVRRLTNPMAIGTSSERTWNQRSTY